MTRTRKSILVTQRVEVVPSYGERRDALDQAWMRLLGELGHDGFAASNDVSTTMHQVQRLDPDLIILSGGNSVLPGSADHSPERNETEAALLDWARQTGKPILGVCRGFQFLNVHLGGALRRVEGHVARAHPTDIEAAGIHHVNSYHNEGIMPTDLAPELVATALAPDGSVEAAQHRQLPWTGVMWHPERAMPDISGSRRWFAQSVVRLINRKAVFELG